MRNITEAQRYVQFHEKIDELKDVERTGWRARGDNDPESVADHSWAATSMAVTTLGIAEAQLRTPLDWRKLISMTLFHDLGEIVTGDIVVYKGGVVDLEARRKKIAAELRAQRKLFAIIGMPYYPAIFREFERGRTPEAKVAIACEKYDLVNRALKLEQKAGKILEGYDDFYVSVAGDIGIIPFYREMYEEVLRRRDELK